MTLTSFKAFVASNISFYAGISRETDASIKHAEAALALTLPQSMTWLLIEHGYSFACGVDALDDTVKTTVRCRSKYSLPDGLAILNDWNDAGIVLLDTRKANFNSDCIIYWADSSIISNLHERLQDPKLAQAFAGFAEWSIDRLNTAKDES